MFSKLVGKTEFKKATNIWFRVQSIQIAWKNGPRQKKTRS